VASLLSRGTGDLHTITWSYFSQHLIAAQAPGDDYKQRVTVKADK